MKLNKKKKRKMLYFSSDNFKQIMSLMKKIIEENRTFSYLYHVQLKIQNDFVT